MHTPRHWLVDPTPNKAPVQIVYDEDGAEAYRAAGWTVQGPFVLEAERPTQVVPCDDAAIERAMTVWPLPGPPIGDDAEAHAAWRRDCAKRVLRAAGGMP